MKLRHRGLLATALSIVALGGVATATHASGVISDADSSTTARQPAFTSVTPNPARAGDFVLVEGTCRATAANPLDYVDVVFANVGDPADQQLAATFVVSATGEFVADWPAAVGEWHVDARCVFDDGSVTLRGLNRTVLVRP